MGLISFIPLPGAGPGAVTPSPAFAAGAPAFTAAFAAALTANFNSAVGTDGLPLFNIASPQIAKLIGNLSSIYATILAGITFVGAYAGSPTVPVATPLTVPTIGSIV